MKTNAQILFDALAERSPDKLKAIGAIARSIVEFQSATAADAKRIAAAIAASIFELNASTVDVTKLADAERDIVERAASIMEGKSDPQPASAARERIMARIAEIARRAERLGQLNGDHGSPEMKARGCCCPQCMSEQELAVSNDPAAMRRELVRLRAENAALTELNECSKRASLWRLSNDARRD